MTNLYLKDGRTEPIVGMEDFFLLVDNYMGQDARSFMEELIWDFQDIYNKGREALEKEMRSYEASLEGLDALFIDIDEMATELKKEVKEAKRLNRDKIITALDRIINKSKEGY